MACPSLLKVATGIRDSESCPDSLSRESKGLGHRVLRWSLQMIDYDTANMKLHEPWLPQERR